MQFKSGRALKSEPDRPADKGRLDLLALVGAVAQKLMRILARLD